MKIQLISTVLYFTFLILNKELLILYLGKSYESKAPSEYCLCLHFKILFVRQYSAISACMFGLHEFSGCKILSKYYTFWQKL